MPDMTLAFCVQVRTRFRSGVVIHQHALRPPLND